MATLQDLLFGFTGVPTEEASNATLGAIGFVFWIFIIIGAIVGGTYLFRIIWLKFQYDEGLDIAPYRFIWMGKFGEIEGNLSVNETFDDEDMTGIEVHTGLKFDHEIVKEQIKNRNLYVYNFRITDEGDVQEDFSKKVRIVSPDNLQDQKFTWLDTKGKRNLGSIVRREKRRNVVLYSTTKRYTVFGQDKGEEIEYWVVSPLPMVDAKTTVQYKKDIKNGEIVEVIDPTPVHFIDIKKLEGGKALSQFLELKPTLDEALAKLEAERVEKRNYEKLFNQEVRKLQIINFEKEELKHKLSQRKYIKGDETIEEHKPDMNIAWILGSALMVFFLVVLLPQYLVSMQLIMAQFMGFGIGTVIIILLFLYASSKKKQEMKELENK